MHVVAIVLEGYRKDFLPEQPLRRLPEGGGMVEITVRCLHGRMLLRPDRKTNEIILGVLGLALVHCPTVRLHGYWFLSNHCNLLATFPDAGVMATFMNFVDGNIARELGHKHDWKEKFWGRRYRAISVLDEDSQVHRLRYLLAQGTKEGLVSRPSEWPGANCLDALLTGTPDVGVWFDRTAEYRARRRGEKPTEYQYATRFEVPLTPLPCWQDLDQDGIRAKLDDLVHDIVAAAKETNRTLHRRPLGAKKILAQHPHDLPFKKLVRTPAPLCHASSRRKRNEYRRWYWKFVDEYRAASEDYRKGRREVIEQFPPGCFVPSEGFRRHPTLRVAA